MHRHSFRQYNLLNLISSTFQQVITALNKRGHQIQVAQKLPTYVALMVMVSLDAFAGRDRDTYTSTCAYIHTVISMQYTSTKCWYKCDHLK